MLDVRYNGGGFTHDQVLNYLGGKEHTLFRQRDGGEGLVLRNDRPQVDQAAGPADQQPLVLATPRSSRTPSARWAWASWSASRPAASSSAPARSRLIDGSTFRIPRIGVFTDAGVNMEKEGVMPDVAVESTPDDWPRGSTRSSSRRWTWWRRT